MMGMASRAVLIAAGFALAVSLSSAQPVAADSLSPRTEPRQMTLQEMQAMPATDRVVVKLREGRRVRLVAAKLSGFSSLEWASFKATLYEAGIDGVRMRRMFTRPPAALDAERIDTEVKNGQKLVDLNLCMANS